jgi:hypothetical protein
MKASGQLRVPAVLRYSECDHIPLKIMVFRVGLVFVGRQSSAFSPRIEPTFLGHLACFMISILLSLFL